MVGLGPVQLDRRLGPGEQDAGRVGDTGPCAAGADVHGDEEPGRPRGPGIGQGDKPGQGPHVVEQGIGLQRLDLRAQVPQADVGAAGIGEDPHAGIFRSGDAGGAVLDDEAVLRLHPHRRGGMQEQVGVGLAAGDHAGRKDRRPETVDQAGDLEAEPDALGLAGGGDAEGNGQRIERFGHPGGGPQFPPEHLVELDPHALQRLGGEAQPVLGIELGSDRGKAAAEEIAEAGGWIDPDAFGRQRAEQDPHGQRLAVDEHAIAIEDDQLDRRHPSLLAQPLLRQGIWQCGAQ